MLVTMVELLSEVISIVWGWLSSVSEVMFVFLLWTMVLRIWVPVVVSVRSILVGFVVVMVLVLFSSLVFMGVLRV